MRYEIKRKTSWNELSMIEDGTFPAWASTKLKLFQSKVEAEFVASGFEHEPNITYEVCPFVKEVP